MADRGDTHYPTSRLNVWFTLSSVFLLASIVWMVLAFECSLRAVPKTIHGTQESHDYLFVEV